MIDELLAHLVSEKMDYKEYMELMEETNDMNLKQMLQTMANDEHEHYKMIKNYLASKIVE